MSIQHMAATVWLAAVWAALGASTVNVTNRYAYAANTGWIDARADTANGAVIGRYVCSNYLYAANTGWIHLGDGTPANGLSYGNASAADYGVNVSPYGLLTGYAWSANAGWISLSNAYAFVQTDRLGSGPDTDGDGLPDPWEYSYTNTLAGLGATPADADGDGSPDSDEYGAGTDPTDPSDLLVITAWTATNLPSASLTWASTDTRFYRVKLAYNLTNAWSESSLGLITDPSTPGTTRILSLSATNRLFLRVQSVLPLSP